MFSPNKTVKMDSDREALVALHVTQSVKVFIVICTVKETSSLYKEILPLPPTSNAVLYKNIRRNKIYTHKL